MNELSANYYYTVYKNMQLKPEYFLNWQILDLIFEI